MREYCWSKYRNISRRKDKRKNRNRRRKEE
jgi:hypothetical protein